ncbi:hypothetical protein Dsin_020443 [Dipteronia sinensis]|uniref:Uncharacterized protein n=1 Tax=Dipteronia sinensis TaxID=43782 RepID=A0AAE0E3H8_9ROSI|nr:hypothetical protein Dsin_020443 [Dipteronia sinensis]
MINESQLDELLDKFLSEIFHLEMIFKDHGLPDSKVLKDQAWSTLKPGLKQYEEDVEAVEMKANESGVLSSIFIHGSADMDESLKQEMELKISKLWTQLKDAEEEPEGSGK